MSLLALSFIGTCIRSTLKFDLSEVETLNVKRFRLSHLLWNVLKWKWLFKIMSFIAKKTPNQVKNLFWIFYFYRYTLGSPLILPQRLPVQELERVVAALRLNLNIGNMKTLISLLPVWLLLFCLRVVVQICNLLELQRVTKIRNIDGYTFFPFVLLMKMKMH